MDIERMREAIHYNPDTGAMTWRHRGERHFSSPSVMRQWNTKHAGRPALAARMSSGHLHGKISGKLFLAHRVAWAIVYGSWPETDLDHINGDRSDNRIANLRLASRKENAANRTATGKSSRFKGVVRRGKTWEARIRKRQIGTFQTEVEAARAYDAAAVLEYGDFACLNFPSEGQRCAA